MGCERVGYAGGGLIEDGTKGATGYARVYD